MYSINKDELLDIIEYEKVRNDYRKDIIAYKKNRRFTLGPNVTIIFENKKTLMFQIQEIMRAERLVHDRQIQEEIDVYSSIMPSEKELSATLFLEVTEEHKIRSVLDSFIGLSLNNSVYFKIGDSKVYAAFESGREKEDNISSVHYIKFPFDQKAINGLKNNDLKLSLNINYNEYCYSHEILDSSRISLQKDLSD